MSKPFSFYKRTTVTKSGKSRICYYVRFRDPETGERLPGISCGTHLKGEAERFAVEYIKSGKAKAKSRLAFGIYAKDFFTWGSSSYIKYLQDHNKRYTHTYADNNKGILEKHILPAFKHKLLSEISVAEIEEFHKALIEKGMSASRVNQVQNVLKTILGEAYRNGYIDTNPMERVERYVLAQEVKGTIGSEVYKELFKPQNLTKVWKGRKDYFLINFIALKTGMRQGEIQALQPQDVKADHILLRYTWDRKYGLKSPKYKSSRPIPIQGSVSSLLQRYIIENGIGESHFIFHGTIKDKPIDHKAINASFFLALKEVGVNNEQRTLRNITFHSWRHTFNTKMRNKIPDNLLMHVTGHKTDEMMEHYTHYNIDIVRPVIAAMNEVFAEIEVVEL